MFTGIFPAAVAFAIATNSPYQPTAALTLIPGAGMSMPAPISRTLVIDRSEDGFFYVDGSVNGQKVKFLVDTGASMVVLTHQDAARTGVRNGQRARRLHAKTANGGSQMALVNLDWVNVGSTAMGGVPAAVAPKKGLHVSLLGQDWLRRMSAVMIANDRMELHP